MGVHPVYSFRAQEPQEDPVRPTCHIRFNTIRTLMYFPLLLKGLIDNCMKRIIGLIDNCMRIIVSNYSLVRQFFFI